MSQAAGNQTESARIIQFEGQRPSKFDRLYQTQLEILAEDAWQVGEVGFISRALVQATLPYREPKGNPQAWGRTNGRVSLVIQPGAYLKPITKPGPHGPVIVGHEPVSIGYPFGSIPRLFLAWVGREVKQKKQREISFGHSLASFMNDLGMKTATGGKNGSITRLREQLLRLFNAKIAILDNHDVSALNLRNDAFLLVDKSSIWWDTSEPNQPNLFESQIQLSERFYNELLNSPVPVDMRILRDLRSPTAIDLYCFLTYTMFSLNRERTVSWADLQLQFGSEAGTARKFKWQFQKALKDVLTVYPDAKVDVSPSGLILKPSNTSVRRVVATK